MIEQILNMVSEKQGWNTEAQLSLLIEYIENQQSPEAFRHFIVEAACVENESEVSNGS